MDPPDAIRQFPLLRGHLRHPRPGDRGAHPGACGHLRAWLLLKHPGQEPVPGPAHPLRDRGLPDPQAQGAVPGRAHHRPGSGGKGEHPRPDQTDEPGAWHHHLPHQPRCGGHRKALQAHHHREQRADRAGRFHGPSEAPLSEPEDRGGQAGRGGSPARRGGHHPPEAEGEPGEVPGGHREASHQ